MNFQLTIDGVPSKLVCVAPDADTLQRLMDDAGETGYRLHEIVSVLYEGFSSWDITDRNGLTDITSFSVLQYEHVCEPI